MAGASSSQILGLSIPPQSSSRSPLILVLSGLTAQFICSGSHSAVKGPSLKETRNLSPRDQRSLMECVLRVCFILKLSRYTGHKSWGLQNVSESFQVSVSESMLHKREFA
jgi:hypothetical protein